MFLRGSDIIRKCFVLDAYAPLRQRIPRQLHLLFPIIKWLFLEFTVQIAARQKLRIYYPSLYFVYKQLIHTCSTPKISPQSGLRCGQDANVSSSNHRRSPRVPITMRCTQSPFDTERTQSTAQSSSPQSTARLLILPVFGLLSIH